MSLPGDWEVSLPTGFLERVGMKKITEPDHYDGDTCLNAIAVATANLKGEEAFCTGNAMKYIWRWKRKNGVEDLHKAKWLIERLIKLQDR